MTSELSTLTDHMTRLSVPLASVLASLALHGLTPASSTLQVRIAEAHVGSAELYVDTQPRSADLIPGAQYSLDSLPTLLDNSSSPEFAVLLRASDTDVSPLTLTLSVMAAGYQFRLDFRVTVARGMRDVKLGSGISIAFQVIGAFGTSEGHANM